MCGYEVGNFFRILRAFLLKGDTFFCTRIQQGVTNTGLKGRPSSVGSLDYEVRPIPCDAVVVVNMCLSESRDDMCAPWHRM